MLQAALDIPRFQLQCLLPLLHLPLLHQPQPTQHQLHILHPQLIPHLPPFLLQATTTIAMMIIMVPTIITPTATTPRVTTCTIRTILTTAPITACTRKTTLAVSEHLCCCFLSSHLSSCSLTALREGRSTESGCINAVKPLSRRDASKRGQEATKPISRDRSKKPSTPPLSTKPTLK